MQEFKIGEFTIYKGNAEFENEYRPELSKFLIDKFELNLERPPNEIKEMILFSFNYFCSEFKKICTTEKSVHFYQFVFSQHEQAIKIALFSKPEDFPNEIDLKYIALYRRVLKWILEEACNIELQKVELINLKFKNKALNTLNRLFFLGDMIFGLANNYSEIDMCGNVISIEFDKNHLYKFSHKPHFKKIVSEVQNRIGVSLFKTVSDNMPVKSFQKEIENSFGNSLQEFYSVIDKIHYVLKDIGGQNCAFKWNNLVEVAQQLFDADSNQANLFYLGLTLNKNNKVPLNKIAIKPLNINRYLYRPILIWNIEGEDFALIGKNAWAEALIQLTTNAIPWGKAPYEWMSIQSFKKYVHKKEDNHDRWLDDEIENRLKSNFIQYFRNIKIINTKNNSISLLDNGVGEIDFIIILHGFKQILIVDSKHFQSKYDMISQRNDYSNFIREGKKGFNNQIERKAKWIRENLSLLSQHYQLKFKTKNISFVNYQVDELFIINTPTFYMFNSKYPIYIINEAIEVILRKKQSISKLL